MNNLLLLEKESTFMYPLEFTTCVSAGPVKTSNCITDLLALWALLEIDDTADMTCTFPQLPDTVSKIKMPLGKPTSKLLEFLGIDQSYMR